MAKIAFVGDIHGDVDLMLDKAQQLNADIIIQVGDFGTYVSEERLDKASARHQGLGNFVDYYHNYKQFTLPTFFIKGNHEDYDIIEEIKEHKIPHLFYLENGKVYTFGDLRIGALGGNYSPQRFPLDRNNKRLQGCRRKHFNYQDLADLIRNKPLNIIVAHDCPQGIGMKGRGNDDCGSPEVASLITEVQPSYYIHGHYHRYKESSLGRTKIICLDKINGTGSSIMILETNNFSIDNVF